MTSLRARSTSGTSVAASSSFAAMVVVRARTADGAARTVTAFWTAYVLTRPVGASFADYVAVPRARGGLHVGTGLVSAVLVIAIAFAVALQEKVRQIPSTETASSVR